ncbi:hypothetical protein Back11_06870 [Paenibacillus baekrokdamisoli]|uniref:Uncharacterized protein n=1 Tax=Paenibacillus baekrokdamisoli TaxID=1712516 RepID=A0A3G9IM90_9BACL|nr:hypothetical protein [Paenibacillus baekrokdamisoli]MBB3067471.1 Na+/melibiose symporter-like transporter [Paenibacillus baekrokdamisoli]BBH19342.1 hypothetical protein Back11_06870 [Paenibacillus baekrokdamisoli]
MKKKVNTLKVALLNFLTAICFIIAASLSNFSSSKISYGFIVTALLFCITGMINVLNYYKSKRENE